MFKGSNNVALGYDEGSILIKVCQLCYCTFKIVYTFILVFVACSC